MKPQALIDRFWSKVEKGGPDECWPWIGRGVDRQGYAHISGKAHNGHNLAHRRALELSGVDVPAAKDVLHSCDNPPCCNPAHLRTGDNEENVRDRESRGRRRGPFGESHPDAKLTDAQVEEIRRLGSTGELLQREIAARFGISQTHVSGLLRGVSRVDLKGVRLEAVDA